MLDEIRWWLADHSYLVAAIAVALASVATLVVALLEIDDEPASEVAGRQAPELAPVPEPPPNAPLPGEGPAPPAPPGDLNPLGRGPGCQMPTLADPVVGVTSTIRDCDELDRLIRAAAAGSTPRTDEYRCRRTASGWALDCRRRALQATLIFGPGGRGLAECGQLPVAERENPIIVRADGLDCPESLAMVSDYLAAEDPSDVGDFECRDRVAASPPYVECRADAGLVVFSRPSARD